MHTIEKKYSQHRELIKKSGNLYSSTTVLLEDTHNHLAWKSMRKTKPYIIWVKLYVFLFFMFWYKHTYNNKKWKKINVLIVLLLINRHLMVPKWCILYPLHFNMLHSLYVTYLKKNMVAWSKTPFINDRRNKYVKCVSWFMNKE